MNDTTQRWPYNPYGDQPVLWFGGDYNPEQWPEDIWVEDLDLMKRAGVSIATVGVFSWAFIETSDGVFDFGWLDRVMDGLAEAGIAVDLATATATPPRWLTDAHPEILPQDAAGNAQWPGFRQHWRPTSPVFRRYALRLVRAMAEHYRDHPALAAWHVSNELGCHNVFDYSPDAQVAFSDWCRSRYGTLDALNAAWNGAFWSQKMTSWEQVLPPRQTTGGHNPSHLLDFKRFSSDALLDYFRAEQRVLAEVTPDVPVTTNLMMIQDTNPVDCFKWGRHMDFVSNDHYYLPDDRHVDELALSAATTSGVARKQPWFLMENSTTSVNWRPVNLRKQPGDVVRDALIHVANGADAVCFFQWRESEAGSEKFHAAMLPHPGTETRVFREVTELGSALRSMGPIVGSTVDRAKVALVFDYDSWWALETLLVTQELRYRDEVLHWYRALLDIGISADVIGVDDDWDGYETVVLPATYIMGREASDRARRYVEQGGHLVSTYASGIADECDHVILGGYPGALRDILGIFVEEFAAIAPGDQVVLDNGAAATMWADDISHVADDCTVIARYAQAQDRGLPGRPALTTRTVGKGRATHVGTKLTRADLAAFLQENVVSVDAAEADGSVIRLVRQGADASFAFVINRTDEVVCCSVEGEPIYQSLSTSAEGGVVLQPSGAAVYRLAHTDHPVATNERNLT